MTPEEALAGAQRLLDASDTTVAGARLAAFVARQALEQLVDDGAGVGRGLSGRVDAVEARGVAGTGGSGRGGRGAAGVERAQRRLPSPPVRLEPAGSEVRDLCAAVVRLMAVGNA